MLLTIRNRDSRNRVQRGNWILYLCVEECIRRKQRYDPRKRSFCFHCPFYCVRVRCKTQRTSYLTKKQPQSHFKKCLSRSIIENLEVQPMPSHIQPDFFENGERFVRRTP